MITRLRSAGFSRISRPHSITIIQRHSSTTSTSDVPTGPNSLDPLALFYLRQYRKGGFPAAVRRQLRSRENEPIQFQVEYTGALSQHPIEKALKEGPGGTLHRVKMPSILEGIAIRADLVFTSNSRVLWNIMPDAIIANLHPEVSPLFDVPPWDALAGSTYQTRLLAPGDEAHHLALMKAASRDCHYGFIKGHFIQTYLERRKFFNRYPWRVNMETAALASLATSLEFPVYCAWRPKQYTVSRWLRLSTFGEKVRFFWAAKKFLDKEVPLTEMMEAPALGEFDEDRLSKYNQPPHVTGEMVNAFEVDSILLSACKRTNHKKILMISDFINLDSVINLLDDPKDQTPRLVSMGEWTQELDPIMNQFDRVHSFSRPYKTE
ncbi:hypothetical protein PROFUN_10368 [Planoprotostelium fungivorum]|uniref:Uncharacterized protein n=1 Tax=Planoprotostelium fungivorum TaxID=1890364 RepID=A0A2P6NEB0_9EUKA|nr:hypothetical protein PROFUN_10368 [Planoprotostelium fungivorum]